MSRRKRRPLAKSRQAWTRHERPVAELRPSRQGSRAVGVEEGLPCSAPPRFISCLIRLEGPGYTTGGLAFGVRMCLLKHRGYDSARSADDQDRAVLANT